MKIIEIKALYLNNVRDSDNSDVVRNLDQIKSDKDHKNYKIDVQPVLKVFFVMMSVNIHLFIFCSEISFDIFFQICYCGVIKLLMYLLHSYYEFVRLIAAKFTVIGSDATGNTFGSYSDESI